MNRCNWFVTFALCSLCFAATPLPAQWQILNSGTTADLRGIDNVGGGVAWASGTNGTVLRTEDGGYLWQPCSVPPGAGKLDFRGIQAFDANTAVAMSSGPGNQSRLYKTADGCQTWKLVFTNPDKDGFWDAVRFADREHGYLLGDPVAVSGTSEHRFVLEQTYDSGRTWKPWQQTVPELKADGGGAGSPQAIRRCSSLMNSRRYLRRAASGVLIFIPPLTNPIPQPFVIAAQCLRSKSGSTG